MQKFKTLADHIALAQFAHRNQTDKAGLPYIDHPMRVLNKVQAMGGLPYVQSAAILHDVTEDTAFTTEMLMALGVSEAVVQIVRLVDRDASRRKWDYIWKIRENMVLDRIPLTNGDLDYEGHDRDYLYGGHVNGIRTADDFYYHEISLNPGAKMVKLADIEDNLAPWRQSYLPAETQERLRTKYAKALSIIGDI